MAGNTLEASRGTTPAPEGAEAKPAAPAAAPGGVKAFLPLILAIVMMPVLAFVTTKFILLPKLQSAASAGKTTATEPAAASAEASTPAAKEEGKEGKGSVVGKGKATYPLTKMLVNVAGTMGTRYLMTSMTLVGSTPDFKSKIEENKDELLDLANGALRTKTIADLEKPDACNVIRSELMTVFNNALGGSTVQQIYITELAIQ